ncbi:MAG: hypothetical protein KDK26_08705, partial [Roseivivax sp.]|nr:hypothetical protein [Roseivivax sp.]
MPADTVFSRDPYDAGRYGETVGPNAAKPARQAIEEIAVKTRVPANVLMALVEATKAQDDATKAQVATRIAEQLAPRLAAGEKIEDLVLGASPDEETGRRHLYRAHEIGAELYPDRVSADPFEGEGALALFKRRGQQAARDATEAFAAVPERVAIAQAETETDDARRAGVFSDFYKQHADQLRKELEQGDLTEEERAQHLKWIERFDKSSSTLAETAAREITPASERAMFKAGDKVREASAKTFGRPDPRDTSFWAKLIGGGANMATMAATSLVAGALTGGAGALVAGAAQGAAMTSSQLYREALAAGASEADAMRSAKWGDVIGVTEIVPIGRALKLLPPRLRQKVGGAFYKRFADIAQSAGEEAAQEFLSTVAQNMVASGIYDPERGWTDGAWENALIGGILGGGMGAVGTALAGKADPVPDEPTDDENPPAQPLALPPPALITPPPPKPAGVDPEWQQAADEYQANLADHEMAQRRAAATGESQVPPPPPGSMSSAMGDAPAPIWQGKPGDQITLEFGGTRLAGRIDADNGSAVTVIDDETGEVLEIPRGDFEAGAVSMRPRISDEEVEAQAGDKNSDLSQRVATAPRVEADNTEPKTAEEARRRMAVLEDDARQSGWTRQLRDIHEALGQIAQDLDTEAVENYDPAEQSAAWEPEAPEVIDEPAVTPPPEWSPEDQPAATPLPDGQAAGMAETITKKDGSPFSNEAAARRGVKSRGMDPDTFSFEAR